MTLKQQINHEVIQKVWHFSSHSPVSHLIDFIRSHPVYYLLKNNKLWIDRKDNSCTYDFFSVSRYIRRGRKSHLEIQSHS